MNNYYSISTIVKELKLDYPKLSNYELLTIAVQKQRNEIIASGLSVNKEDKYPSATEAIAIQLGYKENSKIALTDLLKEIAENTKQ